ncbi:ferritin-like domain-containing protein [Sphaerotilus montanus]|uniref:ferritin-like domain-containing protein n=1 Tax=Sphaerotilus montanus TaxID=522889 RepID=UPI003FA30068
MDLRQLALGALCIADPVRKAYAVQALRAQAETLPLDPDAVLAEPADLPGRPVRPVLVRADAVPPRSPFTLEGRAALLHAIAHIEKNAIDLALDAVWRFPGLPAAYYLDWLRVAAEESTHHLLVAEHLATLGHVYGDFEAHAGLWTMARKTSGDFVARMGLVARTLEARGLDATPLIQAKLRRAGDLRAVEILDVILRDEVGHVAIGNHWYRWACERAGLDPVAHYRVLVAQYEAPRLRPPFNRAARLQAGFSEEELAYLEGQPAPLPSAP